MPFTYSRIVHFGDTDAAGVVYFANVLRMCHEAYEASLAASGFSLRDFFSSATNPLAETGQAIAIPITHADVDFFRPMFCGDRLLITLIPQQLSAQEFAIAYTLASDSAQNTNESLQPVIFSKANTKHVCIDAKIRKRTDLPATMQQWLAT